MRTHPDFICIGAQKAGTGWFYDQVASHPGAWMPPIKELRYFSRRNWNARRNWALKLLKRPGRKEKAAFSPRDMDFLHRVAESAEGPGSADMAEYASLFEAAGDLVTGDVTPAYAGLGEKTVAEIVQSLPDCRFVFFCREPVARLWSQAQMAVRYGAAPATILTELPSFRRFARRKQSVIHSFQAGTIRRWRAAAGPQRFRVFHMDGLVVDPAAYRRHVLAFVGLDADLCAIEAAHNSKSGQANGDVPAEFRNFLVDYFGSEFDELTELLGIDGSTAGGGPATI